MKTTYTISILVALMLLTGCKTLVGNPNAKSTTSENVNTSKDINFDLDINSLTYSLPTYTKSCMPESRNDCASDGNCVRNKPVVFVLYDENTKKVYRCDNKSCDGREVSKEVSGLFTNLTPMIPNGSLVKLASDNTYVETVSIGLDFIIYSGKCSDNQGVSLHSDSATGSVEKYGAEVLQIGGPGSRIAQKTAYLLTEQGYLSPSDDWVTALFNTPADLMWVDCRQDYDLTICKQDDVPVKSEADFGCPIGIKDKMQNKAYIECVKR